MFSTITLIITWVVANQGMLLSICSALLVLEQILPQIPFIKSNSTAQLIFAWVDGAFKIIKFFLRIAGVSIPGSPVMVPLQAGQSITTEQIKALGSTPKPMQDAQDASIAATLNTLGNVSTQNKLEN